MSYLLDAWNWIATYSSYTIELALFLAAIAFYVYAIVNVAIPKLIVAPVCSILVGASLFLYAQQITSDKDKQECDIRFAQAQNEYLQKQLEAAGKVKVLQDQLNSSLQSLSTQQSENKRLLENAIDNPDPPQEKTGNETNVSCLNMHIPANIVRSLK